MNTLTRFAATAASISAISFSLTMNGLYGWNYAPFAFGGAAVAISALIFDLGKAVIFPALSNSFKTKKYGLAGLQGLILSGFILLSFFASLSFFAQIIDGKQKGTNDRKAELTRYIAATDSKIKTILAHKYSNNCMVIDGPFTRRWCEKVNSKTGKPQHDSVPALNNHLEKMHFALNALNNKVIFWGVLPVQKMTGLQPETTMLFMTVLMAVLMEILSGFGFVLLTIKRPVTKKPIKVTEKKVDLEGLMTKEESEKMLMKAMYEGGMTKTQIGKAFDVSRQTVRRRIAV